MDFDTSERKHAHDGPKYIRLDTGTSGAFMVERSTGNVYCIKGYGVIDRKKLVGNVTTLTGTELARKRFWRLR